MHSHVLYRSIALRNHHSSSLLDYDIRYTFKKWCFTICKHAHFRHLTPSYNIIPTWILQTSDIWAPQKFPHLKPQTPKRPGLLGKLRLGPIESSIRNAGCCRYRCLLTRLDALCRCRPWLRSCDHDRPRQWPGGEGGRWLAGWISGGFKMREMIFVKKQHNSGVFLLKKLRVFVS